MLTKYKDEIKGALISTGAFIIVLGLFPSLHTIYSDINSSIFLGLGILALGVFWLK